MSGTRGGGQQRQGGEAIASVFAKNAGFKAASGGSGRVSKLRRFVAKREFLRKPK